MHEMLLPLESDFDEAMKTGMISKEAAKYIQDTVEMIAQQDGYI
jgi:hypothetical protein